MLIVRTEVKESAYGLGLFSGQAIKAGETVWVWDDLTEIVVGEGYYPETFMSNEKMTK